MPLLARLRRRDGERTDNRKFTQKVNNRHTSKGRVASG